LLATACVSGAGPTRPDRPAEGKLVIATAPLSIASGAIRSPEAGQLTLRTPEGKVMSLVRERQSRIGAAGYVWHGRVADDANSTAVLVENNGAVAGTIFSRDGVFQVRGEGERLFIDHIDTSQFPREAEPRIRSGLRKAGADAQDTCATDSGDNIDVMVIYTDDARAAAGSIAAMEAEVYLTVEVTNQTYINSNVTQRLRLVHVAEVNFGESFNSTTDLNALTNPSDSVIDNIHGWRDTFAADSVMMITQRFDGGICGESFIMSPVGNAFENSAFGVVKRSCSAANLSFAHELGHQMSARHDWTADSTNNSPYVFNHGLQRPSPTTAGVNPWRTVMAYNCTSVNCPRILNWSNPLVSWQGDATGVATGTQQRDNAQTLNLTAQTIANFRCSSPGRNDVWAKDRWSDTGVEPEPLTAGQPMWESPYIWVRNTQDNALIHQHEHEDPEFGQQNWAYVKLHKGGGAAMAGTLELWVGAASTGLVWPGSFTQIGAIPVTMAANSSRVVEVPWPSLPATGHYCLVARWVSSSDPMHNEGADINANTIANNNIVWRNVNIVNMQDMEQDSFTVRMRNPDPRSARLATLRFEFPRNANGLSFAGFGEIAFAVDARLLAQRGERLKPIAMQQGDRGWTLTRGQERAELRGLLLPAGGESEVRITLRRPPSGYPRDVFRMRVEQLQDAPRGDEGDGGRYVVGGVTYDIRTGSGRTYIPPRGQ